jgi:hypothetical protein
MYRISFETNSSRWIIQLQKFGFLWVPLRELGKTQSWPDYDTAASYVEKVGLDKVYRNYANSTNAAIWAGWSGHQPMEVGYQPIPQVVRRRTA